MINKEIIEAKQITNVFNWQIADVLGCHENTVIRHLRHELSDREKEKYLKAIEIAANKTYR